MGGQSAITLFFRMIAEKSGWNALSGQVKRAMGELGEMGQAAKKVGMAFGQMGGVVGSALSNLLKGGIWGLAADGAMLAIQKFKEWRESAKAATLEVAKTMREHLSSAADAVAKRFEKTSAELVRAGRLARGQMARDIAVGDAETAEAVAGAKGAAIGGTDLQKAERGVDVALESGAILGREGLEREHCQPDQSREQTP